MPSLVQKLLLFSGGGAPAISVSPASWDFGSTPVGTPVSKEFTIENTGSAPLTVTAINLPTGYTLTDPALPITILAGATDTFTVEASAAYSKVFSGNISIVSNAATSTTLIAVTADVTPVYLWRDLFAVDEAAPLTSPRTATIGTTIIVDTGNDLSINNAAGGLINSGGSPAYGDPQIRNNASIARAEGLIAVFKIRFPTAGASRANATGSWGWSSGTGFSFNSLHILANLNAFKFEANSIANADAADWARDIWYALAVLLRANGAHYFIKGGAYTEWTHLLFTRDSTTTPLYAGRQMGSASGQPDHTREAFAAQLKQEWSSGAWYNHQDLTPTNGDTATGVANGIQRMQWTAATGETFEMSFRRTDDNNRLILRCSQAGSTMKIIEVNAGVETELSSAAQTFTNGVSYQIELRYNGTEIKSWVLGTALRNNTTSSFNQSATSIKVSGFATGANWEAFPVTPPQNMIDELNRYMPSLP